MKNVKVVALLGALALGASAASGQIRITEWMYTGANGEFVEITNVGFTYISLATYSFDDDSRLAGTLSLASAGGLGPGQSLLITDVAASALRTAWNIPASTTIIGLNTANLGRNDEINIFDGTTLVDRLTYGDESFAGTIRAQNRSGITLPTNWGTNTVGSWFFSTVGDVYGSYRSTGNDVGSPGFIPTPGAAGLIGLGMVMAGRRRR
jgi:MYXO-CTERM domain-containing protein